MKQNEDIKWTKLVGFVFPEFADNYNWGTYIYLPSIQAKDFYSSLWQFQYKFFLERILENNNNNNINNL